MSEAGHHCTTPLPVASQVRTGLEEGLEPKTVPTLKVTSSSSPPQGKITAGTAGASLLELKIAVGQAAHPCVALVDNGASHCFLSDRVAQAAELVIDTDKRLSVCMADGELRSSVGLAR